MDRKKLENYRNNKLWLDERLKFIEERFETLNKLTSTYGLNSYGSCGVNDKLADELAKVLDLENETFKILKTQEKELKEVENAIDSMKNTTYRNILFLRYIQGYDFTTIAGKLNYNYVHTCKLHGFALKIFDKI